MFNYLFSSKDRMRMVSYILKQNIVTNKEVSLRTGATKGLVSRYLNHLVELGVLTRNGRNYNVSITPLVRALKVSLNLLELDIRDIDTTWSRGIGTYGSWASGENTTLSDIDIWVLVDRIDNDAISELRTALSERTGSEVNILVLTDERLETMKKRTPVFHRELVYRSIVLSGEGIG